MTDEIQKISATDLRKYRIELPNMYDDSNLTVYEFRLLAHYVRVGQTWESVRTTGKKCNMGHNMVTKTRRSLERKGFITTQEIAIPTGKSVLVDVVDRWAENFIQYSTVHREAQVYTGRHRGVHREALKKEPIKNINDPLKPSTPGAEKLFATLQNEASLKGRRGPQKFASGAQKDKFEKVEVALGYDKVCEAIEIAMAAGITARDRAINYIAAFTGEKPQRYQRNGKKKESSYPVPEGV